MMKNLSTTLFCLAFGIQMLSGQTATAPSLGDGSSGNPYQIATLNNLYWITASNVVVTSPVQSIRWDAHYIQTADIDASETSGWFSGAGWFPIGYEDASYLGTPFTGSYNGQFHSITGLSIHNTTIESAGLFGVTDGATIENLGMVNVSIYCQYNGGGLVGDPRASTLNKCYTTGSVHTPYSEYSFQIGGFVGVNESSTITNCYSSCSVSSYSIFGGFVGYNDGLGKITNCYFSGTVSPTSGYLIGGFVGYDAGSGEFIHNFWDMESSGTADGAGWQDPDPSGIMGKTTTEMKTKSTFTGWDFGSSGVWEMIGTNYPRLKYSSDPALPVELASFIASTTGSSVILNWKTATEINNNGFDIERKSGRDCWEKIGFVQGHGNSNSQKEYSFADQPRVGGEFIYRLKQIDFDGRYEYSPEVEVTLDVPARFSVQQNYPNPFNPTTKIEFSIPSDNTVEIKVFNVLGMEVATVANEHRRAGTHSIEFDASNLSSGIYVYRVVCGRYSDMRKMILVR